MDLMHVFDGRTDEGEYYWFVLAEYDNADELILTMPKMRVSDGIKRKFGDIQVAYQNARSAGPDRPALQTAKEVGEKLGFGHWESVRGKDSSR